MGLASEVRLVGGFLQAAGLNTAEGRIGETAGMPAGRYAVADGTGPGQANQVFLAALSIAAGATQLFDLKGGGGELDVQNLPLAMTAVKLVVLEVTTPAAATSLLFGPQNQTNAAQLWFQAATANFYDTVLDKLLQCDARAGWALDATHKVLAVKNPGAATVAGVLWVEGTK